MRAVFALILSLVLAVGSVAMAVAHGQPSMGQTLTLCSADGDVTITLDQNGQPVPEGAHLCPDCLSASTAFTLSDPVTLPARDLRRVSLHITLATLALPSARHAPHGARDPPARFV